MTTILCLGEVTSAKTTGTGTAVPRTRTVAPLGPVSKEVAVAAGTVARAAGTREAVVAVDTREVEAVDTRGAGAVTGVTAATLVSSPVICSITRVSISDPKPRVDPATLMVWDIC